MRLGAKGRYAVMAMSDIARHGASGDAVCLSDIADRQEISLAYLEQLFAKLRRSGLVTSVRGPGGGYRLARASELISIAAIVEAVDEPITATRCSADKPGGCMASGDLCATHHLWEALGDEIAVFLEGVSLADVAARRVKSRRARPVAPGVSAEALVGLMEADA